MRNEGLRKSDKLSRLAVALSDYFFTGASRGECLQAFGALPIIGVKTIVTTVSSTVRFTETWVKRANITVIRALGTRSTIRIDTGVNNITERACRDLSSVQTLCTNLFFFGIYWTWEAVNKALCAFCCAFLKVTIYAP